MLQPPVRDIIPAPSASCPLLPVGPGHVRHAPSASTRIAGRIIAPQPPPEAAPAPSSIAPGPIIPAPTPWVRSRRSGGPSARACVRCWLTHHRRHPVVHRLMSGARPDHALHHVFAEVLEVGVGELVAARGAGRSRCAICCPVATSSASEASAGAAATAKTATTSAKMSETRTAMAATLRRARPARIRGRHVRRRGAIRERPTGGVEALELWRKDLGRLRLLRADAQQVCCFIPAITGWAVLASAEYAGSASRWAPEKE